MTDATGVPLVVQTTPANVNDDQRLPSLLDARPAVQGPRGRPRRNPDCLFGDRAYGTAEMVALVVMLGMYSFLARRGNATHGSGLGTFRYVVERTISWLNRCRGILVRYEKKAENYLAVVQLQCALLWYRRLRRLTT